jgi:hypothetical protein
MAEQCVKERPYASRNAGARFNFSRNPHHPRHWLQKMEPAVEHALPDRVRKPTEALEGLSGKEWT